MRPRIPNTRSDAPSYAPPVKIGDVMVGGTVAKVDIPKLDGFKKGEWVPSANGWGSHVVVDGKLVTGQNPASSEAAAKALLKLL